MTGPMGGASGNEIGRVSVRVVPDITGFRKKVKKDLKAEMAGFEHKIKVVADAKSLKQFKNKVQDSLNGQTVTAEVLGDTEGFKKTVDNAAEGLETKVKVGADTKKAEKSLDRWQRRYLSKIENLVSEIDTAANLTPEGEIYRQSFTNQLKGLSKRVISLDLKADAADLADLRYDIDELYRYFRNEAAKTDLIPKKKAADAKRLVDRLTALTQFEVDLAVQTNLIEKLQEEANAASRKVDVLLTPKIRTLDIVKAGG